MQRTMMAAKAMHMGSPAQHQVWAILFLGLLSCSAHPPQSSKEPGLVASPHQPTTTVPYEPRKPLKSVHLGLDAECVVDANDRLICWGHHRQCRWALIPHPMVAPVDVEVGTHTVCARNAQHEGACATLQAPGEPLLVNRFEGVSALTTSWDRICWETLGGSAHCRWLPTQRKIGDVDGWWEWEVSVDTSPPPAERDQNDTWAVQPRALSSDHGCDTVVESGTGVRHQCILCRDGTVRCKGDNPNLQLGYVTGQSEEQWRDLPWRAVPGIDDATELAVGPHFTAIVRNGGELWFWGMWIYNNLVHHERTCPGEVKGQGLRVSQGGSCALPQRVHGAPPIRDVAATIETIGLITERGEFGYATGFDNYVDRITPAQRAAGWFAEVEVSRRSLLATDRIGTRVRGEAPGPAADDPLCFKP